MSIPLLSICIPTYNRKIRLQQTIESLIIQCNEKAVELIVSDNASNDGTAEYCSNLCASHGFFHFSSNRTNIGFSRNLKSCLSQAKGKYLWMLSDDEVLHPNAVALILSILESVDPAWLLCEFVKIDAADDEWPQVGQIRYDNGLKALSLEKMLDIAGIWASFMSINIVRKELFYGWLKQHGDADSDYIGFEISMFCGQNGGGFILDSPVLARVKQPLNAHRFDRLDIYLFDFFKPVDELVRRGFISAKLRNRLAHQMFFSMAGFLLLSAKLKGENLPDMTKIIHVHRGSPLFWLIILPVLILPVWLVRAGIKVLSVLLPKKSSSKLKRLITCLEG